MTTTTTTNDVSKVWVGCIGCYNEGNLVGKWMDADQTEEAWESDGGLTSAVCTKPLHEEWRIHDYDGPIASCYREEHPSIDELISMMNLIDEDPDEYTVALMIHRDRTTDAPTASAIEELAGQVVHIGYRSDLKDYFMEWAYDVGYMTDENPMLSYIDWEHFARDCMYDYTEYEYDGSLYIVSD
jgi:antirestriction protein